ncbi:MAG: sensor histidine kinase [Desulfovibrionaceae bacterium]
MFDIPTLLAGGSLATAVAAGIMFLAVPGRHPLPGARWWAVGFGLLFPGLALLGLRGILPDFLSIVVANAFFLAGMALKLHGVRLFTGRPGFSPWQWAGNGLVVLVGCAWLIWFSEYDPCIRRRVMFMGAALTSYSLVEAWTVWRSTIRGMGSRLLVAGHLAYVVASVAKMADSMTLAGQPEAIWGGQGAQLYLLASMAVLVWSAFSFLIMVGDVLRGQLELERERLAESLHFREAAEAVISHDLQSPLVPVVGLAQLLDASPGLSDEQRRLVALIRESVDRMLALIRSTLSLHRLEQGDYVPETATVPLAPLLGRVASDLAARNIAGGGGVVVRCPEGLAVAADAALLEGAFLNLVKNACEAALPGGGVAVEAEAVGGGVRVVITNPGEVPQEVRGRLFRKYVSSRKAGGKGLGSYSARLSVEAHGGTIDLDTSEPGRTTVTVFLPASPAGGA